MPQDLPPTGGYEPVQYKVRGGFLLLRIWGGEEGEEGQLEGAGGKDGMG